MYMYMKKCVESGPVVPVQPHWLDSMLSKVPEALRQTKAQNELIESIFAEVKSDYDGSIRKSMGWLVL